jgi:hypothetical protein
LTVFYMAPLHKDRRTSNGKSDRDHGLDKGGRDTVVDHPTAKAGEVPDVADPKVAVAHVFCRGQDNHREQSSSYIREEGQPTL